MITTGYQTEYLNRLNMNLSRVLDRLIRAGHFIQETHIDLRQVQYAPHEPPQQYGTGTIRGQVYWITVDTSENLRLYRTTSTSPVATCSIDAFVQLNDEQVRVFFHNNGLPQ